MTTNQELNYNIEETYKKIENAVQTKNEQEIKKYISEFTINIKKMLSNANIDKIRYYAMRFVNLFIVDDSIATPNACNNLEHSLVNGINDINFERYALLELRKYLKTSKKSDSFNYLPLIFSVLNSLLSLQESRKLSIDTDSDIWSCAIDGIRYYPATTIDSDEVSELKNLVGYSLQILKKHQ